MIQRLLNEVSAHLTSGAKAGVQQAAAKLALIAAIGSNPAFALDMSRWRCRRRNSLNEINRRLGIDVTSES